MKIRKLKRPVDGTDEKFYPVTIPQAVIDPETNEKLPVTLGKKAEHGYTGEEPVKTLKAVETEKASHGYDAGETPKTLKDVDASVVQLAGDLNPVIEDLKIGIDYTSEFIENKYIPNNVPIGTKLNPNPATPAAPVNCIIKHVFKDSEYKITGRGGTAARLWAFTDESYYMVAVADPNENRVDYMLTAPVDGYIIVNALPDTPYSLVQWTLRSFVDDINETVNSIIGNGPVDFDFNKFYPYYQKIGSFVGDSITWGYSPSTGLQIENNWVKLVGENLQLSAAMNYGISASVIAVDESNPTNKTPMVNRVDAIDSNSSLIVIAGGSNDYSHAYTPFGDTSTDIGDLATKFTFCGAVDIMCRLLIDRFPDKVIVFMTPLKRNNSGANALGKTLADYADAIIEICGRYGIPVFDMFRNVPINPEYQSVSADSPQKTLLINDGVHPNEYGHEVMARYIWRYLNNIN